MINAHNQSKNYIYYINTSKNIIFSHSLLANKIKRKYKSDWGATDMEVDKINKKGDINTLIMNWEDITKEENSIFPVVKPIASTQKPAGFFSEIDDTIGLRQNYLNEYLNSEVFIEAKIHAQLGINPIDLLNTTCPNISILLRNLFHNEKDIILQNFLNWLAVIAYGNKRQDVFWLFKGKSDEEQGQGAGKGVFSSLMSELLSGLVVSVNNISYKNTFNSQLLNMKLIIFDEVNFKSLNYEVVKDMTGSDSISIMFKGKEAMITDNVASWLFFTNEYDLLLKITIDDRRCFLIHPNSINDSLSKLIPDMEKFIQDIKSELPNLINVLAHCDLKVKKPNELRTQAHTDYFNNLDTAELNDIQSISKFFTNKNDRASYFDFLNQLEKLDSLLDFKSQKYFIENKFSFYQAFKDIYKVCFEHKIAGISNKTTPQKAWKQLREVLLKLDYEDYSINTRRTVDKVKTRIKENCIRLKSIEPKEQKKITNQIINNYYKNDIKKAS